MNAQLWNIHIQETRQGDQGDKVKPQLYSEPEASLGYIRPCQQKPKKQCASRQLLEVLELKLGVVVHAGNSSPWEVGEGG